MNVVIYYLNSLKTKDKFSLGSACISKRKKLPWLRPQAGQTHKGRILKKQVKDTKLKTKIQLFSI